jgi:signal peptidase
MVSHSETATRGTNRALQWLRRLLAFSFLAVVAAALGVLIVVPRAVHGTAMTVLTGSMTPSIPVGSVVIVQPVDPRTLHVGDVATYQPEPGKPTFITHRITKIKTDKGVSTYTFKGDANPTADIFPVSAKQIRGKVLLHVPYLGAIRDALHTRGGIAGVAVLLLSGYAIAQVASARRDKKEAERDVPEQPLPLVVIDANCFALQTLVVTLRLSEFEGLPAGTVADMLRMNLVEAGHHTFTVAATREPEELERLADVLAPFEPVALSRSGMMWVPRSEAPTPLLLEAGFFQRTPDLDERALVPAFRASA